MTGSHLMAHLELEDHANLLLNLKPEASFLPIIEIHHATWSVILLRRTLSDVISLSIVLNTCARVSRPYPCPMNYVSSLIAVIGRRFFNCNDVI